MALTRRDVVLAGIISFIAWGFFTHWIPPLRYVGYAFVAGIIATAAAGGAVLVLISRGKSFNGQSRRQFSKSVVFVAPTKWKAEIAALAADSVYKADPLYPSSFVVSENLDGLLELLSRDFVKVWYYNISRSASFPDRVDKAIRTALSSIRDRIAAVDIVEIAVSRFVPIITAHMKDFYDAEKAVRGKHLNRDVTESEELDLAIARKFRDGKLHPAASLSFSDTKILQQEHLRKTVEPLISAVLPENMIKSRAVMVLIKEIVACAVLFPMMQILSDPDTWNQLMEAYGRTMMQDRKTVRKLRAALDEHASPAPKSERALPFPRLGPNDNERKFERFIRATRRCNNLSDARRFRSEVSSQLKRESQVEGQEQTYLRRLETGKKILDQKVSLLAAGGSLNLATTQPATGNGQETSRLENASLRDILQDSSGLSYFMEYMDRQRLMTLIQFWIVVNGFRNPLEEDVVEGGELTSKPPKWTESDRVDLAQISEAYFPKPELKVPDRSREAVRSFLKSGQAASPLHYQEARGAILRAQTAVLQEMQSRHFPNFKKSDLYYKYLTSDEASSRSLPSTSSETNLRPLLPERKQQTSSQAVIRPTPPVFHTSSRLNTNGADLRTMAKSSSDLRSTAKKAETDLTQRRSFDSSPSAPLFDDDDSLDEDPLARSMQSIDGVSIDRETQKSANKQIVEAMEAALTDIVEDAPSMEDRKDSLFGSRDPSLRSPRDDDSPRSSFDSPRVDILSGKEKEKPSIASLGLVNTSSRIGVFSDEDLFPDEEKFIQDEHEDPEGDEDNQDQYEDVHEAVPGDLGLVEAIAALSSDIERLIAQDSIVDSLTRKAELTNNTAELRILRKSKSSLQREIRRKEMQRQQYTVQESDNSLYGRAALKIKSIMVGNEEDGREYALCLTSADVVEVQRKAGEQMPAATWAIARRYSEFHQLHQKLRTKYPSVKSLEFPRRRVVMKLQREFLHKRRVALEHYLNELLLLPDVCRSRDLRAFLSQQAIISNRTDSSAQGQRQDIVTRIYNSVADGMEDFLGNIPVLDQLSVAGQNLISAATNQLNTMPTSISEDPIAAAEAEAELKAFENRELEPFVKPICDIFLEIFELNRSSNWLRGRAVVVVLHQLLGGTIERKVRETARTLVQDDSLLKYINLAKDTMWPDGKMRRDSKIRTASEKARTRTEASLMLATLVPDVAGSVVGRANAQAAGRRLFATLNNPRLNTHLAFTLLDEVVLIFFGDYRIR
ncbi:MAG: Intermediate filament protein [Pycnora praestabilis]|nr:MAG: Intermediate filament protein [Pycnora praestabilis]